MIYQDRFEKRHIGVSDAEIEEMLNVIGVDSLDQLIKETVPEDIILEKELDLPAPQTEHEYLKELKKVASLNKVFRSYIGMGYYGTITPSVILRNIFENPGWYTQYTPYQAEISQGRLEALLNFQTMVSDLTAMPVANASLLDEGTAAAEAMTMFFALKNKRDKTNSTNQFLVSDKVHKHTLDILYTRAEPLGIKVVVKHWKDFDLNEHTFGILLQYPNKEGNAENYRALSAQCNDAEIYVTVAADILSLALLTPPGEWGADAVVGNTQRFGVPMGFGGPHAAYFATKDSFKRQIPGRIIGVSIDRHGNRALRMALQTREQHIRRDKATSNICTAQALLAIMAGMYATYHGQEGIKNIATRIHVLAKTLSEHLVEAGFVNENEGFFDTLKINCGDLAKRDRIYLHSLDREINLKKIGKEYLNIALDETTLVEDIEELIEIFTEEKVTIENIDNNSFQINPALIRTSEFLTHPVFNSYHTETKMMRYIKRLENKDLSLTHSMIPLGSCTMKLNAATQLRPVSWSEFAHIHPFSPHYQTTGYQQIIKELEQYLCEITGFTACSLQPNSGAQGEYAGLLTIRAYHQANGNAHRNIALIPSSAHGTNPASAVMAGMKVVVVKCDERGNIDVNDLKEKAEKHKDNLASLMVTYPSTHGVFETEIKDICDTIHQYGGKVYMDGANMNAQCGLTNPGIIGADVCHLNLHKTFAIPHGGGGPGMGPICVNDSLAPYLPKHVHAETGGDEGIHAVSSAPFGSASILLISYAYIRMLGASGVTQSTRIAILNANYIKARLEGAFNVLYLGHKGHSAHELIVDLRHLKSLGLGAEDVAKRLIDYGFHAPTLSFPVAGTIMIEPTESEDKEEIDRFCDALLAIRKEIDEVASDEAFKDNNVLVNAPHTLEEITHNEWTFPYSREKAAYPLPYLREGYKFWAAVGRVNNAHGDRNLICTCPPIEAYENSDQ